MIYHQLILCIWTAKHIACTHTHGMWLYTWQLIHCSTNTHTHTDRIVDYEDASDDALIVSLHTWIWKGVCKHYYERLSQCPHQTIYALLCTLQLSTQRNPLTFLFQFALRMISFYTNDNERFSMSIIICLNNTHEYFFVVLKQHMMIAIYERNYVLYAVHLHR